MMKLTQSIGSLMLGAILIATFAGCSAPTGPANEKANPEATQDAAGASAEPNADPGAAGSSAAGTSDALPGESGGMAKVSGKTAPTGEPTEVEGVMPSPPAILDETADPYFVLFMQLFEEDPGLNGDIRYIAVDLNAVKAADCTAFLALMADFCAKQGVELLEDDIQGLTEKGLVKDMTFRDGIVFIPSDESLTESRLISKAQKWRSGDGAIGATYTVEKKKGRWAITKIENQWIS